MSAQSDPSSSSSSHVNNTAVEPHQLRKQQSEPALRPHEVAQQQTQQTSLSPEEQQFNKLFELVSQISGLSAVEIDFDKNALRKLNITTLKQLQNFVKDEQHWGHLKISLLSKVAIEKALLSSSKNPSSII